MNFFVISDIHGSIEALEKAMERFQVEKADYIIICGDFLNHGPRNPLPEGYNTKAVAEKLNSIKDNFTKLPNSFGHITSAPIFLPR